MLAAARVAIIVMEKALSKFWKKRNREMGNNFSNRPVGYNVSVYTLRCS